MFESGMNARVLPKAKSRLQARAASQYEDLFVPGLVWFVIVHFVAVAFGYLYFSWPAFIFACLLHSILGPAITLGAHRYFSHASFQAPQWLENLLAVLYTLSFDRCGEGIISWVAGHKFHHAYPDADLDPHSPVTRGFWHAYCGHYLFRRRDLYDFDEYRHYCPGLARKPFLVWIDQTKVIFGLQALFILFWFVLGATVFSRGPLFDVTMGASFFVWCICVRYCYSQFCHGMVDTISHGFGQFKKLPDTYNTGTSAKNNLAYWTMMLGNETWHNIHHAFPRAADNGPRWYRWDLDSWLMALLERLGIIRGLHHLTEAELAKRARSHSYHTS